MNKELVITLKNHGFSDKEALLYLTLLEGGKSGAAKLSRMTGIKRVTIYALLKSMIEKSIVTSFQEKGVNIYVALSPSKILNRKKQQLDDFEQKIPDFLSIADKRGRRPQIEYFDGISGIKRMYDHLLLFKNPIYAFLSDDNIHENLQDYLNIEFVQKRRKKEIHAHVLVNDAPINQQYKNEIIDDPYTTVKLIKESFEGLQGEIILYGENNIMFALYSPDELVGYIIESRQLYTSLKTLFTFVRKHA